MMKILSVVLILITFFSCGKKGQHLEKKYDKDGNLEMELEFLDDKPHGIGKHFYPDGKIWKVLSIKNGELHGKSVFYYKNGKVESERNFKDGKLNGKEVSFYDDGIKKQEIIYSNGKELLSATFYENGSTLSVKKGNKVTIFSESGNIIGIDCLGSAMERIGILRFSEDNKMVKVHGSLLCLSKSDSTLLDLKNPKWQKLITDF